MAKIFDESISEKAVEESKNKIIEIYKSDLKLDSVETSDIQRGRVNKYVTFGWAPEGDESRPMLLLKIWGKSTEDFIDRPEELRIMESLYSEQFFGSKIVCSFKNAICYEYIPGQALSTYTIFDVWAKSAVPVAKMHSTSLDKFPKERLSPSIYKTFNKMLSMLDNYNMSQMEVPLATKEMFENEFKFITKLVDDLKYPLTLCHNDLNPTNFIRGTSVWLIDYEFCGVNYFMYDIANFFCECMVHFANMYGLYPCVDLQKKWIDSYLASLDKKIEYSCQHIVDNLKYFVMLSHLFWSLWAVVNHFNSEIDYGYKTCLSIRLNEYFRIKNIFFTK